MSYSYYLQNVAIGKIRETKLLQNVKCFAIFILLQIFSRIEKQSLRNGIGMKPKRSRKGMLQNAMYTFSLQGISIVYWISAETFGSAHYFYFTMSDYTNLV